MPVKPGLSSMSVECLGSRATLQELLACCGSAAPVASSCCTLAVSCWDGEAPWEVCVSQNTRSVQSEAGAGTWAEISSDGRQQLQHLWCKTKGQKLGSCTVNAELTTWATHYRKVKHTQWSEDFLTTFAPPVSDRRWFSKFKFDDKHDLQLI